MVVVRPLKDPNAHAKIMQAAGMGNVLYTAHSDVRGKERHATRPEIEYVLKSGHREESKDEYKSEYGAWNYAIRGRTVDGKDLRVAVFLADGGIYVKVATVIVKGRR